MTHLITGMVPVMGDLDCNAMDVRGKARPVCSFNGSMKAWIEKI